MICKCSGDRKLGLRWLREKKTILRVLGFHGGIPRRIVRMTLKQIASLGKELAKFLALFACCFRSRSGFASVHNLCPRIALEFATQERRGHRLGVWQMATHSTTFRGI